MAIDFNAAKGKAESNNVNFLKIEGENKVRLFGGILASYTYWLKNDKGNSRPFECLQFDPKKESFVRGAPDPVREFLEATGRTKDEYGNDIRCKWSYKIMCYNYATSRVELFTLKKGLLEDLMTMNGQLTKKNGSPTSPTFLDENGYDFVFTRTKTGPKAFDVKYAIDAFATELAAASAEVVAAIEESKDIDELQPRMSLEDQRAALETFFAVEDEVVEEDDEGEGSSDLPTNFGG